MHIVGMVYMLNRGTKQTLTKVGSLKYMLHDVMPGKEHWQ